MVVGYLVLCLAGYCSPPLPSETTYPDKLACVEHQMALVARLPLGWAVKDMRCVRVPPKPEPRPEP